MDIAEVGCFSWGSSDWRIMVNSLSTAYCGRLIGVLLRKVVSFRECNVIHFE